MLITKATETRKAGFVCVVPGCGASYRKTPNVKMFKFPKRNTPRWLIWIRLCNLSPDIVKTSLYICGKHFRPELIGIRMLKTKAIPTLHLPNGVSFRAENNSLNAIVNVVNAVHQEADQTNPVETNQPVLTRTMENMCMFPGEKIMDLETYRKFETTHLRCRLCLKEESDIKSLSSDEWIQSGLTEAFETITSVPLQLTAEYSKNLCKECEENLRLVCRIRNEFIRVDKMWKTYLNLFNNVALPIQVIKLEPVDNCCMETEIKQEIESLPYDSNQDEGLCKASTANDLINTSKRVQPIQDSIYPLVVDFDKGLCIVPPKLKLKKLKIPRHRRIRERIISKKVPKITRRKLSYEERLNRQREQRQAMLIRKQNARKYYCDICSPNEPLNLTPNNLCGLRRHIYLHRNPCRICTDNFTDAGQLVEHQKICLPIKPKRCYICDEPDIDTNEKAKKHTLENHPDIAPFQCDNCDAVFYRKHNMIVHWRRKFLPFKYKCNFCDRAFKQHENVIIHEARLHTGKTLHLCDTCGQSFTKRAYLMSHCQSQHGSAKLNLKNNRSNCNTTWTCNFGCGYKSNTVHSLLMHLSGKHGEYGKEQIKYVREVSCTKCNLLFSTIEHATQHNNNVHVPYECKHCIKRFKNMVTLESHVEIHKNVTIRPYSCEICLKSFNSTAHLRRHIVIVHEANRKYQCSICPKNFLLNYQLKHHVAMAHETIIKLFKCEVCSRPYGSKSGLKHHQYLHSKQRLKEKCSICGWEFNGLKQLSLHTQSVHLK